jgi:hypothetical protein
MTRLSTHFQSQADEARVARVWGAVDHRLQRARKTRPFRRAALFVAAGAVAAALVSLRADLRPVPHAVKRAPQLLELPDGSRVEHAPEARIAIEAVTPSRVELRMTRGHAQFRVAPNHERAFLTHAAGYTIRVVGTEFAVDLGARDLRVAVSRGVVEVRRDGAADVWRVRAGETWSSTLPAPTSSSASEPPRTPPRAADPASVPAEVPSDAVLHPQHVGHTESLRAVHAHPAPANPDASSSANTANTEMSTTANQSAGASLFQRAQAARAAGSSEETARLLDELLRRFPSDPRAGIAAFQLGRLRLASGDPKAALQAFDRAGSAGSAFQEQVAARRVQALEQLGDLAACRSARADFLRDYSGGSFAEVVRRRCP